jgi:hypothetical protein
MSATRPEETMPGDDRRAYPWWVRVSLFGSRTRSQVMTWCWLCLVFCPVCLGIGIWLHGESPAFRIPSYMFIGAGVGFIPAAALYWLAARWVDRHGNWPRA